MNKTVPCETLRKGLWDTHAGEWNRPEANGWEPLCLYCASCVHRMCMCACTLSCVFTDALLLQSWCSGQKTIKASPLTLFEIESFCCLLVAGCLVPSFQRLSCPRPPSSRRNPGIREVYYCACMLWGYPGLEPRSSHCYDKCFLCTVNLLPRLLYFFFNQKIVIHILLFFLIQKKKALIIIICLLCSLVFLSGCVQHEAKSVLFLCPHPHNHLLQHLWRHIAPLGGDWQR